MIYSTISTNDYVAAIVTEDFVNGGSWNETKVNTTYNNVLPQVQALQSKVSGLERLENAACIRAYGTSKLISNWMNVLVVTNLTRNDTLFATYTHSIDTDGTGSHDQNWLCSLPLYSQKACDTSVLLNGAEDWSITGYEDSTYLSNIIDSLTHQLEPYMGHRNGPTYVAPVQYCLAETFEPHCTVAISTSLLSVVIVCNVVKACCLIFTLLINIRFDPLATVGDAISSFISHPDGTTRGKGPLSALDVRRGHWKEKERATTKTRKPWGTYSRVPGASQTPIMSSNRSTQDAFELLPRVTRRPRYSQVWLGKSRRWFRSVSIERWVLCIFL